MLDIVCFLIGYLHIISVGSFTLTDSHASLNRQVAPNFGLTAVKTPPGGATQFRDMVITRDEDAGTNNDDENSLVGSGFEKYKSRQRELSHKKLNSNTKRYLDGIASSFIKRQSGSKRYLDDIGGSFIKKSSSEKDNNKRYIDSIGSNLFKKSLLDNNMTAFRYFSNHKDRDHKHFLDSSYGLLHKRYLDGITSSLIKRRMTYADYGLDKRYLDGITSSLIKKRGKFVNNKKRYLDNVGSSLIKRDMLDENRENYDIQSNKRYLDSIGSGLMKRKENNYQLQKKYIDYIGNGLLKKSESEDQNIRNNKAFLNSMPQSHLFKNPAINSQDLYLKKRNDEVTNDAFVVKRDTRIGN